MPDLLPNSENIRLNDHLQTLDRWAEVVKKAEEKYLPTFYRNPAQYENSLSKFKAITLVLTFKEDLKCGYNMELVRSGAMQDWKSNNENATVTLLKCIGQTARMLNRLTK